MKFGYFLRRFPCDRGSWLGIIISGFSLAVLASLQSLGGQEPQARPERRDDDGTLPLYAEYSRRVQQVLRREATAEAPAERVVAVQEMCLLFSRIVADPRYATSPTLQTYKAQLAARLRRVKADLERQINRHRRQEERRSKRAGAALASEPSSGVDLALGNALELASQTVGGPPLFFEVALTGWQASGASGGAAVWDYGPALVELIQRTITPSFWDVNGGPGTIVYYRPLRVLVVRATPGMHFEVGDALGKLRGR